MDPGQPDLSRLSDVELGQRARDLQNQIAVCIAQIEAPAAERKRTLRIARGTFLTAAGFFGLTLDPISGVVAIVGFFDWIEGIRDDAEAMNHRNRLNIELNRLREQLAALEEEVRHRGGNI